MSVAAPLVLCEGDWSRLEVLTRASSIHAGLTLRARIVLLPRTGAQRRDNSAGPGPAAEGRGLACPLWHRRDHGLARPAAQRRPVDIDDVAVVVATLAEEAPARARRGDLLIGPVAGRRAEDLLRHGQPDLAPVASAALAVRDL